MMDYKDDFFTAYRKYLDFVEVARAHRRVFSTFRRLLGEDQDVTDLGCGTAEFGRYMDAVEWDCGYRGVDLDISRVDCGHLFAEFRVGNYRDYICEPGDVFVSLFATEIHMPWDEHEALYDRWFHQGARIGLVGGFYYLDRALEPSITERHTGMVIHQSCSSSPLNTKYHEMRICQQVPAGMFVDPFVEVWRILHRA